MNQNIQLVALHLPQYHPIPENDLWWGKGFTEWTNVTKAKPLFRGHHQPNLPSDLGFYDMRLPETWMAQAELAKRYGINGFCYYHYWFGRGRRLLEQPLQRILNSDTPNFPFMICWANQSWSGVWHGLDKKILIEQEYPGEDDDIAHFEAIAPILHDRRYIRVEGKPAFMLYSHSDMPDVKEWAMRWRRIARNFGFDDLYLITEDPRSNWDCAELGFDAYVNKPSFQRRRSWVPWTQPIVKFKNKFLDIMNRPTIIDASSMIEYFVPIDQNHRAIPCLIPNWDNTPRSGAKGLVLKDATPEVFSKQIDRAQIRASKRKAQDNFIFIKSWNEWGEGNYLEPSVRWGHKYLEVIAQKFNRSLLIRSSRSEK